MPDADGAPAPASIVSDAVDADANVEDGRSRAAAAADRVGNARSRSIVIGCLGLVDNDYDIFEIERSRGFIIAF